MVDWMTDAGLHDLVIGCFCAQNAARAASFTSSLISSVGVSCKMSYTFLGVGFFFGGILFTNDYQELTSLNISLIQIY